MARHITDTVTYNENRWHCEKSLADLLKGFRHDLPTIKIEFKGEVMFFTARTVWFRKDGAITIMDADGEFWIIDRKDVITVQPGSNRAAGLGMWITLDRAFRTNNIDLL